MALTKGKQVDPNMKESRQLKTTMVATKGHPYYQEGETFTVHPAHEGNLIDRGWAVKEGQDHTKVKDIKKPAEPKGVPAEGGK